MKSKQGALMPWNFDTRVVQRNIAAGVLTASELKAIQDALPDLASKAEPIRAAQPGHEIDDADLDEVDEEQD